ncbi:MAG: GNAT family N-acetyltransferase [Halothiobacillaceae bacterium]|jgi:putative hemolysin|nr:GNAT family N-acetyltransferase [Halothiobacillaceae bacterium]MDY0049365.1 GNAT family N-acyltransferase [Halothiobacillaceae bacterium]
MEQAIIGDIQRLSVELAVTDEDVRDSQRLRHRVFVEEMGAASDGIQDGIERDYYDEFCHHLIVRDQATGEVVASTRILTDTQARLAGGFYSENEFDMTAILGIPGRVMEIGRTCVHPDYRNGGTIGLLWSGLARFMDINRFGHLIGCASISMQDGGIQARAILDKLRGKHLSPEDRRVVPRLPLPESIPALSGELRMPPLLKAYMRLGAQICGEPCWDPAFGTADVFVLLDVDNLHRRYYRHFIERQQGADIDTVRYAKLAAA